MPENTKHEHEPGANRNTGEHSFSLSQNQEKAPLHSHTHTHTKAVLNRMSRAIGHLESVKRMVEDGRDCSDVLIQLAAVRSAIGSTAKLILKDHIEHCVVDAVETNDTKALEELNKAIELFMR